MDMVGVGMGWVYLGVESLLFIDGWGRWVYGITAEQRHVS